MILDLLRRRSVAVTPALLAEQLRGETGAGQAVSPDSAMRLADVFACVRVLAEGVGQLPLLLYKVNAKGRTLADSHPLWPLLTDSPNPNQTWQEFAEMCTAHLALRGNFYAFKNVVDGRVVELLPLSPGAVSPRFLPDGVTVVYDVTFASGKASTLKSSEIFHVKLFSLDGLCGMSPIAQAREAIGLAMATEQHGARLFRNGAMPGGVLSTEGELTDEAYGRIREDWNANHQGTDNAHRMAILEAGLKWTATGLTNEDAQFLDTRKFQRAQIAAIFRVPPHMIADLDRATFSNIEHQGLEFVTNTLRPYLTRISNRVRVSLLSKSERSRMVAEFDVRAHLVADLRTRAAYFAAKLQAGALSPNEWRAEDGQNPRDGGDIYLTPVNMTVDPEANLPPDPTEADPTANGNGDPASKGFEAIATAIKEAAQIRASSVPAPKPARRAVEFLRNEQNVVIGAREVE